MRNCFCTAQVFASLCKIVSRCQGTQNEGSGKITKSKITRPKNRKVRDCTRMKSYARMVRHDARSPRLGVCLTTSSRICITELKAHEKQGSRQEAYDKLTRPKTTESLSICAYMLMYNQQRCVHGQARYMELLLLCEFLWLATSAKY
jgi:hypothetical protein